MIRVLGLIPARGGSQAVPRKNARPLGGKPLVQHAVESALRSQSLAGVVVSTDDDEIAAIGLRAGAEVPFRRPAGLAGPETPMLSVVQHALGELEKSGRRFDAVCLLQPTNPLRRAEHIDACVALLEESGADAVVTVLRVPAEHNPHWVYLADPQGRLHLATGEHSPIARRQDLPAAFHREGSVYVTRRDVVMVTNSLYGSVLVGYELDPHESVNIDDWDDWVKAEQLLARRVS